MLTWRKILEYLHANPQCLNEPAQIVPYNPELPDCIALQPVIAIKALKDYELNTRGVKDNQHHPEHVALLADCAPFSEAGEYSYEVVFTDDNQLLYKTTFVGEDGKLETSEELVDDLDLADRSDIKLTAIRQIVTSLQVDDPLRVADTLACVQAIIDIRKLFAAEQKAREAYRELMRRNRNEAVSGE